jgi:hypothetical protein
MDNTDDNDSEIFYDAYERISECQKNSTKDDNCCPTSTNVFSKVKRETEYHDVIDINDKEYENVFKYSKEKVENQIFEVAEKEKTVIENKTQINQNQKFEKKIDLTLSQNESDEKRLDKLNMTISRIKSENIHHKIKEKDIDIDYLKQNLKHIQTKSKGIKDKHFQNLFELQCFQGDSQQILVAKISYGGKYLATGGLSGVLKIWTIYTEEDSVENYESKGVFSYLKFLNENAYRVYTNHKKEIIEINWHQKVK